MKKIKTNDIIKRVASICDQLDELDDYLDSLPVLHSEMDLRMSDLYHPIENTGLTATQAKRFTDEIQSVCNNRRVIKTDISYAKVFRDNIGKLLQKGNRQLLMSKLYSLSKQKETTEYKYRVYSEQEIDKLLGAKKTNKVIVTEEVETDNTIQSDNTEQ